MKTLVRRGAGAVALGGAMLLSGCGSFGDGFFQNPTTGTTTTTSGGDYVYSVNSDSTISAFEVASGALTAISGNPISPGSAYSVTVSRPDTYVYVGGAGAIYCYSIGTSGALTEESSSNYIVGTQNYVQLDTSPNGDYLVALSQSTGAVPELSVFSIDTTNGSLTLQANVALPISSTTTLVNSSLKVSPNSNFVGVALGSSGDLIYPLETASPYLGTPQQLAEPSGFEDNTLAFDSTSGYVYVGRYGLSAGTGTVVGYSVASSGALTQVSSIAGGNTIKSLIVNSAGTDLYTADFSDSTISGYSVSNGVLKQVTGSPFDASTGVTAIAMDNSGKYVIAAATGGTDLTLYQFDALNTAQLDALATYGNGASSGSTSVAVATTH